MTKIKDEKVKTLILFALAILFSGCVNNAKKTGASLNEEGKIYELSFQSEKLKHKELKSLKRLAKNGDAEAAFRLYGYYGLGAGQSARLSQKYLDRAIELDHPAAIYKEAFLLWTRERNPDVQKIYELVTRAIELGYTNENAKANGWADEQDLLQEVKKALETGVVPLKSKFRLFFESDIEKNEPTGQP